MIHTMGVRALIIILVAATLTGGFWGGMAIQRAGIPGRAKRLVKYEPARTPAGRSSVGSLTPLGVAMVWLLAILASLFVGLVTQRADAPQRLYHFVHNSILDMRVNRFLTDQPWPHNEMNVVAARRLGPSDITPTQPVLVVIDSRGQPLSRFAGEILLAEGFNQFQIADVSQIAPGTLDPFDLVIVASSSFTQGHFREMEQYLTRGGNIIALKPDRILCPLLGLIPTQATLRNGYIHLRHGDWLDEPVQFRGTADVYELDGADAVAWLQPDADSSTTTPAIARHHYGKGTVVCFTYDFLWNLMCLRQGDPSLSRAGARGRARCLAPQDLFRGVLDDHLASIPQADIHQHILSNLILELTEGQTPLPRWYTLPGSAKSLLVVTGDGCATPRKEHFEQEIAEVEAHGGRMTFYFYFDSPVAADRASNCQWISRGHATSVHPFFDNGDASTVNAAIRRSVGAYRMMYGTWPKTTRTHCLRWSGYTDQADIYAAAGIKMDLSYISHGDRMPIYMSGSGLPMRFADPDRGVIDCYQQSTHFSDDALMNPVPYGYGLTTQEATMQYLQAMDRNMDRYHTPITINVHPANYTRFSGDWMHNTLSYAKRRCLPIWSADQWLTFWEAREQAEFTSTDIQSHSLCFQVQAHQSAACVTMMIPVQHNGVPITAVQVDGQKRAFSRALVWGRGYALVDVSLVAGAMLRVNARYESSTVADAEREGMALWGSFDRPRR